MGDRIAEAVYVLCTGTSLLCCVLLFRSYARTRMRLLLWSALCFFFLALNNGLLFVDKVILPETDLTILRTSAAFVGILLLLYGLVWDTDAS